MGQTAEAGLADLSPSGKGPVTGTPAETRPAVLVGLRAHLVEPRQCRDTVHQPVAAQVDEHRVLASVQKVNLQRYQLGEPVTVQGLAHAGVLRVRVEVGTDKDFVTSPLRPLQQRNKFTPPATPSPKAPNYLGITLCCVQHQSQGLQQQLLQSLPILDTVLCREWSKCACVWLPEQATLSPLSSGVG